ncbi:unnamed protein product [Pseudo-nitzschia multistriata]|uniref:PrsW family intramembrane metalloprotease n=1 Tax=Pseudo-nitzschia multistriata TaxID=183589 RepID=A0A448ZAD9_9STRA|nr:unnamed protein product [Pseudo-nitzschia multistriata]
MMRHQHHHPNSRREYRGGWSTSMGALLDDPNRKSNCCALTCCGIFLYDRTNYLVTGNRPNWTQRQVTVLIIPLLLVFAIAITSAMGEIECEVWDDECIILYSLLVFSLQAIFVAYLIFLCCWGRQSHGTLRQAVHRKMRDQQRGEKHFEEQLSDMDIAVIEQPVGCCSCYPYDVEVSLDAVGDDIDVARKLMIPSSADLSTCLFRVWSNFCCGTLCQCWCQCCGMCAIGQEDRELELILKKNDNPGALHIDYITFQPYSEYFPAIRAIQNSREASFSKHWSALSELSKRILRCAFYVILISCSLFVLSQQEHYGIKIGVALGVWIQPCIVLYFVWWRWNRFDISFDAVIKYFASGYVIGVFQAFMVETIMSIPYGVFATIELSSEVVSEVGQNATDPTTYLEDRKNVAKMMKDYWGVNALYLFVGAFIMAAFVEEVVKYYCYWTIEMPEQIYDTQKSKISQANYVTIGMVSASLGFACKENMQYVFQSQYVGDELLTLFLRSLLALHPLCAAIQSLGVIKRDILGDPSSSLGRILLPAVILHGAFDFAEMLLAYFLYINDLEEQGTFAPSSAQDTGSQPSSGIGIVSPVGVGGIFMIVGLMYYFFRARLQQNQLALAHMSESTSALELSSFV